MSDPLSAINPRSNQSPAKEEGLLMLALEAWAMVGIHVCGTDDMRGCCYSCSSVAVTVACWSVPMAQEVRASRTALF